MTVLAVDVLHGPSHDMLRSENREVILRRIRQGEVSGVWLGTPCTSMTRARRGKPGSGWPAPLRSAASPDGLSDLPDRDRSKVETGNALAAFSARVIVACVRRGVPVAVENPGSSFLWLTSWFTRLAAVHPPSEVVLDYCSLGTPWRKRTKLRSWHLDLSGIGSKCSSSHGLCSFTGRKHLVLEGRAPDGRFWTVVAQPYPKDFCRMVAKRFIAEWQNHVLERLWAASC